MTTKASSSRSAADEQRDVQGESGLSDSTGTLLKPRRATSYSEELRNLIIEFVVHDILKIDEYGVSALNREQQIQTTEELMPDKETLVRNIMARLRPRAEENKIEERPSSQTITSIFGNTIKAIAEQDVVPRGLDVVQAKWASLRSRKRPVQPFMPFPESAHDTEEATVHHSPYRTRSSHPPRTPHRYGTHNRVQYPRVPPNPRFGAEQLHGSNSKQISALLLHETDIEELYFRVNQLERAVFYQYTQPPPGYHTTGHIQSTVVPMQHIQPMHVYAPHYSQPYVHMTGTYAPAWYSYRHSYPYASSPQYVASPQSSSEDETVRTTSSLEAYSNKFEKDTVAAEGSPSTQ